MDAADQWDVVMGTGHRKQHLHPESWGWVEKQCHLLPTQLRDRHGTRVGISGMAWGFDLWWAAGILAAGLTLWAYVPYPQQPDRWPRTDQNEWHRIVEIAGREPHKLRMFGGTPNNTRLWERNDAMVYDAHAGVACARPHYQSETGGTYGALAELRRRHRPIVKIDPDNRLVTWPDPEAVLF